MADVRAAGRGVGPGIGRAVGAPVRARGPGTELAESELDDGHARTADELVDSTAEQEVTRIDLEPYVESDLVLNPSSVLERLDHDHRARRAVVDATRQIIEESGPISVQRPGRRLVKAYGRTRLVDHRRLSCWRRCLMMCAATGVIGSARPAVRDPLEMDGFRVSADIKACLLAIVLLEIARVRRIFHC